jgi:hypothetical protein
MPRLRPLAWSGVRRGEQDGTSDVMSDAQDAQNDVRSGAQVRLRARLQRVQLPAQLSNSIGLATSLNEPTAAVTVRTETVNVASSHLHH